MPARTSSQFSAMRDQATSPRRESSPVDGTTRSTRSLSLGSGGKNDTILTKQGVQRVQKGVRQASAASVDSGTSATSGTAGRTGKATRGATASQYLPTIQESLEIAQSGEDEEEEEKEDSDEDQEYELPPNSPDFAVQISENKPFKTHAEYELENLDPFVVEYFPHLFEASCEMLDLLAPISASENIVESIQRDLKDSGSRLRKKFGYLEMKFDVIRENFSQASFNTYVSITTILRKFLGSAEPNEGVFRPDAIIHAANLTLMIMDFLRAKPATEETYASLELLDMYFPEVFLRKFDDSARFGSSVLFEESFYMALEIRTMYAVIALYELKEYFKPEQILVEKFYLPLAKRDPQLSLLNDTIKNAKIKNIFRSGPTNSADQARILESRVKKIAATFRRIDEAVDAGEVVDYKQLNEWFPWSPFLTRLVNWSRTRFNEITASVASQGGVDDITKSLLKTMAGNHSPTRTISDRSLVITEPHQLPLPTDVVRNSQSAYTTGSLRALRKLMKRHPVQGSAMPNIQRVAAVASSSRQAQPETSRELPRESTSPEYIPNIRTAPPETLRELPIDSDPSEGSTSPEYLAHVMEEAEGEDERVSGRPAAEYIDIWDKYEKDKNNKNRPLNEGTKPFVKKRLLDRQEGAHKVQWQEDSQDMLDEPPSRKRPHQEEHEDDDESIDESIDEGFQDDERVPDPKRRAKAPPARSPTLVRQSNSSKKRGRTQRRARSPSLDLDKQTHRRNHERGYERPPVSVREVVADGPGEEDYEPPPTFTQVAIAARTTALRKKIQSGRGPQTRIPWSEADSKLLVDLIEQYGCSWSLISRQPGWIDGRDELDNFQVQIKDKARNLKAVFLKAGFELPVNFENIRLGQKEIAAVRSVIPDYEE